MSGEPKSVDSEVMLQSIDVKLAYNTRWVSSELDILQIYLI